MCVWMPEVSTGIIMKSRFDHKPLPLPLYWRSGESGAIQSYPTKYTQTYTVCETPHGCTQEFPEPNDNTEGLLTYLPSSSEAHQK